MARVHLGLTLAVSLLTIASSGCIPVPAFEGKSRLREIAGSPHSSAPIRVGVTRRQEVEQILAAYDDCWNDDDSIGEWEDSTIAEATLQLWPFMHGWQPIERVRRPHYLIVRFGLDDVVWDYLVVTGPPLGMLPRNMRIAGIAARPLHGPATRPRDPAIDMTNFAGRTALLDAVGRDDLAAVRSLLARGADPNDRDMRTGETALYEAARHGRMDMARLLLASGAAVDMHADGSRTPLGAAVVANDRTMAKLLLEHGANVNAGRFHDGYRSRGTPLHLVSSAEMCDLLLAHGADIEARGWGCDTPLHALIKKPFIVARLLRHRADVNARNGSGETPLYLAANFRLVTTAQALIDAGANVNARNRFGRRALHEAARRGYLDMIKLLVERGADVNCAQFDGRTPLAEASNPAVIEFLLAHGAREDPSYDAVLPLLPPGTKVRSNQGAPRTALHVAAEEGRLDLAKALLSAGVYITTDKDGCEPLHLAIVKCKDGPTRREMVKLLLAGGADPSSQAGQKFRGQLPLEMAIDLRQKDVVGVLLSAGANPDCASVYRRRTAVHIATDQEDSQLLTPLLHKGANVAPRDEDGNTPLHIAAARGRIATAKTLLEHGAKVEVRNRQRQTPLQLAEQAQRAEMAELLREWSRRASP